MRGGEGGRGGREGRGWGRREGSVMGSVTILQWSSLEHNYWKKARNILVESKQV